jgi:hypothetical protein
LDISPPGSPTRPAEVRFDPAVLVAWIERELRCAIEEVDQAQVCALLCNLQTKPFARCLGTGNAAAILCGFYEGIQPVPQLPTASYSSARLEFEAWSTFGEDLVTVDFEGAVRAHKETDARKWWMGNK